MRAVEVRVAGPGAGRESAIRTLATVGLDVRRILDVTPSRTTGAAAEEEKGNKETGPRQRAGGKREERLPCRSRKPPPEKVKEDDLAR